MVEITTNQTLADAIGRLRLMDVEREELCQQILVFANEHDLPATFIVGNKLVELIDRDTDAGTVFVDVVPILGPLQPPPTTTDH